MRFHKGYRAIEAAWGQQHIRVQQQYIRSFCDFYRLIVAFGITVVIGVGYQDDLREPFGHCRSAPIRRGVVHYDDFKGE